MKSAIDRDERTLTVENASYRWAYHFVSIGILVIVAFRSFTWDQASWDLLALVVLGGVVASWYQLSHRVLTRRWLINGLAGGLLAAIIAALAVWLRS